MNEPEISKESVATPDPVANSPTPAPDTEPFIGTLHRMWARLKAHKVVQWTLAYLAIAYTLLHGAEMLAGSLNWSHGFLRVFTLVLILGVPVVVTLAWYHGARGLQRVSGTEIMIIAILLGLGGAFLWRDSADHEEVPETAAVATPAPAPALPVVPVAPDDKSIAVLPFVDMSAEKNQEYMSHGMSEEILNLLAQAPDLKVIARTSSFAFKDQNIDIAEIAKKLNVAHVLEGSVRISDDKLRITAQLVRTADSTHLWSEKYDRPLEDIFEVQDEIANAIVQALQIKLMGGNLNRRQGGTQNLEAYRLYLQAGTAQAKGTQVSLNAAEDYLRQAIELDPAFGRAWSRRAVVVGDKVNAGYITTQNAYRDVQQYIENALKFSPENAEAHAALAALHILEDWDWVAAERDLERALALDPNNSLALTNMAVVTSVFGNQKKAERYQLSAISRDPNDLALVAGLAGIHYSAGRFTEAERILRSVIKHEPERAWIHASLSKILLAQGKAEAGLEALQQDADEGAPIAFAPIFLQALGRQAEADAALEKLIERWADDWAVGVAQVYAFRGEIDPTIEWLERAYVQKDSDLLAIIDEPLFNRVVNDPRFQAFVRDKLKIKRKLGPVV